MVTFLFALGDAAQKLFQALRGSFIEVGSNLTLTTNEWRQRVQLPDDIDNNHITYARDLLRHYHRPYIVIVSI